MIICICELSGMCSYYRLPKHVYKYFLWAKIYPKFVILDHLIRSAYSVLILLLIYLFLLSLWIEETIWGHYHKHKWLGNEQVR